MILLKVVLRLYFEQCCREHWISLVSFTKDSSQTFTNSTLAAKQIASYLFAALLASMLKPRKNTLGIRSVWFAGAGVDRGEDLGPISLQRKPKVHSLHTPALLQETELRALWREWEGGGLGGVSFMKPSLSLKHVDTESKQVSSQGGGKPFDAESHLEYSLGGTFTCEFEPRKVLMQMKTRV